MELGFKRPSPPSFRQPPARQRPTQAPLRACRSPIVRRPATPTAHVGSPQDRSCPTLGQFGPAPSPAKAKFRMQDFAGNNLVGAIPYFVIETFNQPLRRHLNLLRRSCATTSSGRKFLKHADSRPKLGHYRLFR